MEVSNHFKIADFHITIIFKDTEKDSMKLLPSFCTFTTELISEKRLFTLTVHELLEVAHDGELIRNFDTGNGETLVYLLPDGGYQYIIRDIKGNDCCLLQTNRDFSEGHCALRGTWNMRSFGLNDALMLLFAFSSSFYSTLLIHASCVKHGEWAYPFIAKSGTGKSTHSGLWMKHVAGTELLNDDNPIIRIIDGKTYIYGSPWSGKTPCYRNVKVSLGAITKIDRAPKNSIERLKPVIAFASMLPVCSSMKWDKTIYNNICNTITRIVETIPVYTIHCLPDEEAAILCHKTITR